MYRNDLLEF